MDKEKQFMKSPLVAWVKTFDDGLESVKDLADGVVFNKIMHEVDPNTYGLSRVVQAVCDEPTLRLRNLQLVVNCIKHFYMVSQKQLVITSLPEVVEIAHEPGGDKSLDELEKLIILLLGCTIHSENNSQLIAHITKNLEPEHQHALVFYIQKITDSTEFVCNIDWTDFSEISKTDLEALCRTAYIYLQRVAKERDYLFDTLVETTQERNFYKDQQNCLASNSVTPVVSPQVHPELIELKKQTRALHEDIERKNDQLADQEDELKQAKLENQRLHHEKLELLDEAKSARAYRDELETLRVQSAKVEKLENEVKRYKQKSEDAEYLRKRVIELKQQNELMSETKSLLEQKVTALTARSDLLDEIQVEVASLKAQVESLHQEKQMDLERIEDLVAQNARYELENKSNQEQIIQLTTELKTERDRVAETLSASNSESSLSFEMSEANLAQRAKLSRLEKEKKEMEKSIEAARHNQAKVAELEKTNKKLYAQTHTDKKEIIKLKEEVEVLKVKASRVDKLQTELSSQREKLEDAIRSQSRIKELKAKYDAAMEAKVTLEDQLEDLQGKVDMLEVIQKENAQLKAQMDSMNMESSEDHKRIQELMEQNAQLDLENQRKSKKLDDVTLELEQERNRVGASPAGSSTKLSVMSSPSRSESDIASKAKIQRLEKELAEFESTKETLRHFQAKVSELEKTTKKLNKQAHSDKREIIRLKEEVEVYKTKTNRLERRRSIKMSTSGEASEEMDTFRGKITELKQQNTLILESKVLLEEEVNSLRSKLSTLSDLQSENAVLKVRLNNLEQESQEEAQRMQDLLQENAQLELQKERNVNDIETLKKELDKLRTAASKNGSEVPHSPVGPLLSDSELATRAKLLRTERDYHELQCDFEMHKKRSERAAAELENTNKKLNTQMHSCRKEIVLLKETLKQEKRTNEQLTSQVRNSVLPGTNSIDGQTAPGTNEQKKIKELGSKLDEVHSQSLAIKEERINQLEKRLEELRTENNSLQETIKKNEQSIAASAGKLESKWKEKNALLAAQVADSRHENGQLRQGNIALQDRLEMFEQLNLTLEEEKKTLLLQVNKLLEQNQGLLMRTLEDKDHELEEERVYSDRLSELEREKALLAEKLKTHERQTMMDMIRQRDKKKNPLKRTMKKIKGKFQKGTGRTITFSEDHGLIQPDPMTGVSTSFSPHTSTYLYSGDASPLSSNQSLSSNSRHSDSYDEIEGGGSAPDVSSALYIPRGPTLNSSASPVVLRQRKTQSLYNPTPYQLTKMTSSPALMDPDRADVVSLQEFLEEANKTPNRRKMMEIKRASIITTPDVTPRNSMLFGINMVPSQMPLPDQMELQDFLKKFHDTDETMSIPEVEDEDSSENKTGLAEEEDDSSGTENDERNRTIGSITPNEANEKTFNLNLRGNANNNNNNNNSNTNSTPSLERLSPFTLHVPSMYSSSVGSSSSINAATSPVGSDTVTIHSPGLSYSVEQPFLMTHPLPHSPRRYSVDNILESPPTYKNGHSPVDDRATKLNKKKMHSSFADLTSSSVKPRSVGSKAFHKSIDDLDEGTFSTAAPDDSSNKVSGTTVPKFQFVLTKPSKEPSFADKENSERLRRKLFGGSQKKKSNKTPSNTDNVPGPAATGSTSPQLNQPPSVKNKVSISTVV